MTIKNSQTNTVLIGALAVAGLAFFDPGAVLADDAVILASCKDELRLSDSGCACVLDKVHSELSDKQMAFFVAAISADQAAMMAAQMELTGAEMMEMATFMTAAPQQCQGQ